jgi:hypothetical protein
MKLRSRFETVPLSQVPREGMKLEGQPEDSRDESVSSNFDGVGVQTDSTAPQLKAHEREK